MNTNTDEKKIEKALKGYNESYARKHPEWAEYEAKKARMFDEEVASEAVRTIWSTVRFEPYMQAREIGSGDYLFGWRILDSNSFVLDVMNKLLQDENAAKQMAGEDIQLFSYGGPNSDGGFEAYAVFRIPEDSRAVIIRLCK